MPKFEKIDFENCRKCLFSHYCLQIQYIFQKWLNMDETHRKWSFGDCLVNFGAFLRFCPNYCLGMPYFENRNFWTFARCVQIRKVPQKCWHRWSIPVTFTIHWFTISSLPLPWPLPSVYILLLYLYIYLYLSFFTFTFIFTFTFTFTIASLQFIAVYRRSSKVLACFLWIQWFIYWLWTAHLLFQTVEHRPLLVLSDVVQMTYHRALVNNIVR